jgi:RecA-family ATPase
MNDFAGKVHLAARAGMENILGHVDKESGRFEAHGLFHDIYKAACDMEAKVIALDNAMQLYHGNLNDPGEVTRFLNALDGLAKDTGAAVIVAGHIAKTTGSQFSGTMAWENAVRMRHFLSRPTDEQGNEIEATDSRILSRGKANAARKGERLEFSWYKGAFYSSVHIDMNSLSAGIDARADNAFLACLDRKTEKEVHVSNSSASPSNFAPKIFEKMAEADGFNRKQLEAAMWRLLKDGVIEENRELPWKTSHRKPAKGLARSTPI